MQFLNDIKYKIESQKPNLFSFSSFGGGGSSPTTGSGSNGASGWFNGL